MLSNTTTTGWVIPEAPAPHLGARLLAAGILGAAAVLALALGFAAALVPTYIGVVPASQAADARSFAGLAAPLVVLGFVLAAAAFGAVSARRSGVLAASVVAAAAAIASGSGAASAVAGRDALGTLGFAVHSSSAAVGIPAIGLTVFGVAAVAAASALAPAKAAGAR